MFSRYLVLIFAAICTIGVTVSETQETSLNCQKQGFDDRCNDIDECLNGTKSPCPESTFCLNTEGSFKCLRRCNYPSFARKYINNRIVCEDINECQYVYCGENRRCVNTVGGYRCLIEKCRKGFYLKDNRCRDINECRNDPGICGKGSCFNYYGSFYCYCNNGYRPNRETKKCVDVDECASRFRRCIHKCVNTEGSYKCQCPMGYTSNGPYCKDINECSTGTHNCIGYAHVSTPKVLSNVLKINVQINILFVLQAMHAKKFVVEEMIQCVKTRKQLA